MQPDIKNELSLVASELRNVAQSFPKPFVFLRSQHGAALSSNVADDVIIIPGTPVPKGFKGIVEDFNVNFTTVAGTVKVVILSPSGSISVEILLDITNNTSGIGKTILDEGESLAVVGQIAGAGTFEVYCSGEIVKQL